MADRFDVGTPFNQSPHQNAWMIKIRLNNPEELKELLSAEEYEEYLQEQAES